MNVYIGQYFFDLDEMDLCFIKNGDQEQEVCEDNGFHVTSICAHFSFNNEQRVKAFTDAKRIPLDSNNTYIPYDMTLFLVKQENKLDVL